LGSWSRGNTEVGTASGKAKNIPPSALDVTTTDPVCDPAPEGVNVKLKLHVDDAAMDPEHVPLTIEKSPEATSPRMFKTPKPEFVRVTSCVLLVLPTACAANVTPAGAKEITGTSPAPLKDVTWEIEPAESLT